MAEAPLQQEGGSDALLLVEGGVGEPLEAWPPPPDVDALIDLAVNGDWDAGQELDQMGITSWRWSPLYEQHLGNNSSHGEQQTAATSDAGTAASAPGGVAARGRVDVAWKTLTTAGLEDKPPKSTSATWDYFRCALRCRARAQPAPGRPGSLSALTLPLQAYKGGRAGRQRGYLFLQRQTDLLPPLLRAGQDGPNFRHDWQ